MSIKAETKSVGSTTATQLSYAETETHRTSSGGRDVGTQVIVYNNSATTIYVGGPAVTSSIGVPVAQNAVFACELISTDDVLYGITASGTAADVRVVNTGV